MANIKKYFRNTLIGLATMVLASMTGNSQLNDSERLRQLENDDDFHMFI
jgi:hypothetical protein